MRRPALLAAVLALALAPVALAANPVRGATYRGTETKSLLTVSKDGKTVASLRLQASTIPSACRVSKPLTRIKIKGGKFAFKGLVGKLTVIVKGEFPTNYLATITATLKGPGCNSAFSDALAKH